MTDMNRLKRIDTDSFTKITASIATIWGIILAVILLITLAIIATPALQSILTVIILSIPVFILFGTIISTFLISIIYNWSANKVSGITFSIDGIGEINKIGAKELAVIGLIVGTILALINLPANITSGITVTTALMYLFSTMQNVQGLLIGNLLMGKFVIAENIIIDLIMSILGTFVTCALFAILYNLLSPVVGGIKVTLNEVRESISVDYINPISAGLISAICFTIIGFIFSLFTLINAVNITEQIVGIIILAVFEFVAVLIIVTFSGVFYNKIADKIGGVKVEIE